jgi:hypothetical protein
MTRSILRSINVRRKTDRGTSDIVSTTADLATFGYGRPRDLALPSPLARLTKNRVALAIKGGLGRYAGQ